MKRKGISYDVGTITHAGATSRENLSPAIVQREIEIIKNDLHCNAVRISGRDISRLTMASEFALQQGLEVWFSPAVVELTEADTRTYFAECAKAAEKLRRQSPNVVFVTGTELTMFMKGLVEGDTMYERMGTFMKPLRLLKSTILRGSFNKRLNSFLTRATAMVRQEFHGQLSYASGVWESVDWSLFDIVGVDHYRDAMNKATYREKLRPYFKFGKPVVITEFGCCTYRGADDKGGYGYAIIDWTKTPPQLNGTYVRDETTQANYLMELLQIFHAEPLDGAFVFTFVSAYPYNPNPLYDLDMASFGVVKTLPQGYGKTYPDMPWEPKQSFPCLAEYYARI